MLKFLVLLGILVSLAEGFQNGAPTEACESLTPHHGPNMAQASPPPFTITPSSTTVVQGETIHIEIRPMENVVFKGFLMQARNKADPSQIIGHFISSDSKRLINCRSAGDTATHKSPAEKRSISFEWKAPADFTGKIFFRTTIVQNYAIFWVNIPSATVTVNSSTPPTPPQAAQELTTTTTTTTTPSPPASVDPFYNGCGVTKTCFGFPNGCIGTHSCDSVSAVEILGEKYYFELKAFTGDPKYVAVGLSSDDKMGDDSVIECVVENNSIVAYSSWTHRKPYGVSREGVPQNIIRLQEASYVNGEIYCKVERDVVSVVHETTFDLANNSYYLLLASGTRAGADQIHFHDIGKLVSSQAIKLSDIKNLGGASVLFLRIHGILMIIAWIGTTSIGILLARYFKRTWVGKQLCGKDHWFVWHRVCMITTWALTMTSFVIIFVEIDGWSTVDNPHAILGTVTTILCFFQPIGAMFRPAPDGKYRPIFNWGHWVFGNSAHLLSIITIFFAVKLQKADLPSWVAAVLAGFVAFYVFSHTVLMIFDCMSDRRASKEGSATIEQNILLKSIQKKDAPFSIIRKLILISFISVVLTFVITLACLVVMLPREKLG